MPQTKLSCEWNAPQFSKHYQAAVSLHSHTNYSKESLQFIPNFTRKCPLLHWALERKCSKSRIPVDFARAYWTPPLTAKLAYEVERKQIENELGLNSLVSLTDHDTIEAPVLLRELPETSEIPLSLEWSVPFNGAVFHLGVHNLPNDRAQAIVADLAAYTRNPSTAHLCDLMAMLDRSPDMLVVINHPLWDLCGIGQERHRQVLDQFLQGYAGFLHAFELNATRNCKENNSVLQLADRWQRPAISGGDRHGRQPSCALNLTRADNFVEFIREIRLEQRSHVLFMPQYVEPRSIRITQTLLDVIRDYPDFPIGSRRWDERVFHPDRTSTGDCPISTLWKAPPAFIGRIFSAIRLLENASVRHALGLAFKDDVEWHHSSDIPYEATL